MNTYSPSSRDKLDQCDKRLQFLFEEVLKIIDHTIITGRRGEEEQNELFRTGRSKLKYPESKHNRKTSQAVDAAPYPIDWKDRERATLFAGIVLGVASSLGFTIRWGGDWDRDFKVKDNHFDDLWHFEILDPPKNFIPEY